MIESEDRAKRILITGGAGFIGSAACRRYVREGWRVLNIDKLTYAGNLTSLACARDSANYRFEHGDIADRDLLDRLFADFRPSAVLHLAAETHVDRSITDPDVFVQTNIVGTQTLLNAARAYWGALRSPDRELFRFVHVSTDEVFGELGAEGAFSELSPYAPRSPYAASKASADHLVRAWGATFSLPVIIGNCSNNYGPYQFPEKLIPLTILNALEGKPIAIYGNGGQVRDWLYVEDHIDALVSMVERGRAGKTYLVGGRNERTNLDVVHAICDAIDEVSPLSMKRRELIHFVADRPGHDRRYSVDCTKIERELGWLASTSFEEGLLATVRWFIANEDWWRPIRAGRYGGERLGLLEGT